MLVKYLGTLARLVPQSDTTLGDIGPTFQPNRNEATKRVTAAYFTFLRSEGSQHLSTKRWASCILFLPRKPESLQPIQNITPIDLTHTAFGQHLEWRLSIASISSYCGVLQESSRWGSAPIQAQFRCLSGFLELPFNPIAKMHTL